MKIGKIIFKNMELSEYLANVFKYKEIKEYSILEEKQMKKNPNYTNIDLFIDINSKFL